MRKLLVAGALAVIALLVLVLYEIHAQVNAAPVATSPAPAAVASRPAPITHAPVAKVATAPDGDNKVNANSDEFFDRFVERQPKVASRAAMTCYRRDTHRRTMDQWIRFSFVAHIKNGEVTFSDVKAKESRLDDRELEDCMLAAVATTRYLTSTTTTTRRRSTPSVAARSTCTTTTTTRRPPQPTRRDS
jgi:hypothetical protein